MSTIRQRIDYLTSIPNEYRREDPPAPRGAKVGITSRCNFKCSFCAHSSMSEHGDMPWETYVRVVRELRDAGVSHIGLFYLGESFVIPSLPEYIRYAVEAGFENVFLTTNGSLASPDRVKACMEAGLTSLKFSLNYVDHAQMTAITKVKSSIFDTIEKNIMAAKTVRDEGGYRCDLSASYIDYTDDQRDRMAERVAKMAPYLDSEPYALPLYNQAGLVTNAGRGNPGRADAARPLVPCWVLFTQAHITHEGKLSACCFDHPSTFICGDLTEQSFMDAWHSERFRELRRAHLNRDLTDTACYSCIHG
jgi:MoaA/NifB/PqqE/SkfB family radical SAM enzyme